MTDKRGPRPSCVPEPATSGGAFGEGNEPTPGAAPSAATLRDAGQRLGVHPNTVGSKSLDPADVEALRARISGEGDAATRSEWLPPTEAQYADALERTDRALRDVLAGTPVRDADEILAANAWLLFAAPTEEAS